MTRKTVERTGILQAILLVAAGVFQGLICSALAAENPNAKILYSSRVYQRAGRSYEQLWEIDPRDGRKVKLTVTPRDQKYSLSSLNKQSIIFVSSGEGKFDDEIWSFDRGNGRERRLFKAGGEEHVTALLGWSADGKDLFLSMVHESYESTTFIATLQIPDGKLVRRAEGITPAFAPDGKVIQTQGNKLADLREGKLPAWSPDGSRVAYVSADSKQLRIVQFKDGQDLAGISLPDSGEYWNYPTSVAWSPDGKLILVGSEAGSSTSSYEDYWLLDWDRQTWQYAGGGNAARWSPDGSEIVWSTPRDGEPLGRMRVWVVHLVLVEARNLTQQILTSGISYESYASW